MIMIQLSRLNGKEFILNCELIKFIEAAPDTIITLTTGEKFMVQEPVDQVVARARAYRQSLQQAAPGSVLGAALQKEF